MVFSKKAENISSSITLAITAKANELKAQGVNVIGFGAGEPDFNTPQNIIEAAIQAMKNGHTKYTPSSGIKELKEAIINKLRRDNNLQYNLSEIIVSTGAKQCLANAFMAILNPGDEVIIGAPYWVTYPELVKLSDGKAVFLETSEENDFKLTIENLKKAYTSRTKALLINSPNNPTGTVYSEEDLRSIAEFAKEKDILIISDEIYEKLIYDEDAKHVSIASLSEDAFNRTIVINGMSKSYAMTGWRIGYAASGCEKIIKLMSNIQSHTTSNVNSIAQYASIEALNGSQKDLEFMIGEFKKRREYMIEKIKSIDEIYCNIPKGAFYVMINISKLFGKKINDTIIKSSFDFCSELLDISKVAAVPGAGFGNDNYIRVSYATSMENVVEGLNRIEEFIHKLK